MRVARRNGPPNQGARRSGSGSLTRTDRPKTVTLATSSTPGGRATRRRGRRQATTPSGVGAIDSREDRSPTPEPPGTRVFSREIRTTRFPQRFRQPTSIDK
jgi:hypothetical protein